MNNQMKDFARKTIKEGLSKLPENCQIMFIRMYSRDDLKVSVNDAVDIMPEAKLDWAMQQIENSLAKQRHNQSLQVS